MTWTSTMPTEAGRYWWGAPDRYGRPESQYEQYGLMLVQWDPPSYVARGFGPPRLRVRTLDTFCGSGLGGEADYGGWSGGGISDPCAELPRHYPGIQIWSVPERGPDDFLPELPPKPAWSPPTSEELEAKRKKTETARKASAKRAAKEVDERAQRITEAQKSGETLYECDQCNELLDEDALVQIRECPHCQDAKFNGTENGQNCPTCNRSFTRNYTEHGCPDCLEECEPLASEPIESVPSAPKKRKR